MIRKWNLPACHVFARAVAAVEAAPAITKNGGHPSQAWDLENPSGRYLRFVLHLMRTDESHVKDPHLLLPHSTPGPQPCLILRHLTGCTAASTVFQQEYFDDRKEQGVKSQNACLKVQDHGLLGSHAIHGARSTRQSLAAH